MKLRQHRRRTLTAMLWRKPIWVHWAEVGIKGEPTGNGGFKFVNLHPRTEYDIRVIYQQEGDRVVPIEAYAIKLYDEARQVAGMTAEMRAQPSDNKTGPLMEFRARQRYNNHAPPDPEG